MLGRESREIRGMSETQEELKNVLKTLAASPNDGARLSDELRSELRLLSRTIAAASTTNAAGPCEFHDRTHYPRVIPAKAGIQRLAAHEATRFRASQ